MGLGVKLMSDTMNDQSNDKKVILYFDRDTQRSCKNRSRLLGALNNYGEFGIVSVSRVDDVGFEKGATETITDRPHAAYIIHQGSPGYSEVLTTILLAASERGENPKIGVITAPDRIHLLDDIRKEARSLGVEAVIEPICCPPNGYFCNRVEDPCVSKGRETIKRILNN